MTCPTWARYSLDGRLPRWRIRVGLEWIDLRAASELSGIGRQTLFKRLQVAQLRPMSIDEFFSRGKLTSLAYTPYEPAQEIPPKPQDVSLGTVTTQLPSPCVVMAA